MACSIFEKKVPPVLESTKVTNIDRRLLEPCSLLDENIEILTFEDALLAYSRLGEKYSVCAKLHDDSVIIMKQMGNIK